MNTVPDEAVADGWIHSLQVGDPFFTRTRHTHVTHSTPLTQYTVVRVLNQQVVGRNEEGTEVRFWKYGQVVGDWCGTRIVPYSVSAHAEYQGDFLLRVRERLKDLGAALRKHHKLPPTPQLRQAFEAFDAALTATEEAIRAGKMRTRGNTNATIKVRGAP